MHDNPPGISGWLIEGRTYYDAFVFNNKKDAIALVIDDQVRDETDGQDNSGETDGNDPATQSDTDKPEQQATAAKSSKSRSKSV